MDRKERIERLTRQFDVLKDLYYNDWKKTGGGTIEHRNLTTIADKIIIPMFELDSERAISMWKYMLTKYIGHCQNWEYGGLSQNVLGNADFNKVVDALKREKNLIKYCFELNPSKFSFGAAKFMTGLCTAEEFEFADELMELISKNNYGENKAQKSIYWVLFFLLTDDYIRDYGSDEVIQFARKWADKLTDEGKFIEMECIIDDLECYYDEADDSDEEDKTSKEEGTTVSKLLDDVDKGVLNYTDPDLAAADDDTELRFCKVKFNGSDFLYTYYCPDETVTEGNGYDNVKVVKVFFSKKGDLDYPWQKIARFKFEKKTDKKLFDEDDLETYEEAIDTMSLEDLQDTLSEAEDALDRLERKMDEIDDDDYYSELEEKCEALEELIKKLECRIDELEDEEFYLDEDDTDDEEDEDDEYDNLHDNGNSSGWYPGNELSKMTSYLDDNFDQDGDGKLDNIEDFVKYEVLFDDEE